MPLTVMTRCSTEPVHQKKEKLIALFLDILPNKVDLAASMKGFPLLNGVSLFQVEESFSRTPFQYNSEIIILAQGEKNVYLGNKDVYCHSFFLT